MKRDEMKGTGKEVKGKSGNSNTGVNQNHWSAYLFFVSGIKEKGLGGGNREDIQ